MKLYESSCLTRFRDYRLHCESFFDDFFILVLWRDDQTFHRIFCSTYERARSTSLKEIVHVFFSSSLNIHLLMKNQSAVCQEFSVFLTSAVINDRTSEILFAALFSTIPLRLFLPFASPR